MRPGARSGVFLLRAAIERLWICVPELVTTSFTVPAGALSAAGVILKSVSVTSIEVEPLAVADDDVPASFELTTRTATIDNDEAE